ncbi:fungal-specific transcription factor domain-containing protein [Hypoxylon rubiginosum]|uniref:Fungal-specific transcription factor domain-containing protein n=1 Tax=Hypoxylon rubiginosum TaxID=110542 RepID=A0ACC0DER2_9PEZI|nr:fungal-specific transcription factor domain-containing protein [Hypoxylon rubiginosum]
MQRITRAQAAARRTCTVCHQRKVRCDAQEVGFPCTNCQSASRDDCQMHQKRKRGSARPPPPSPVPYYTRTSTQPPSAILEAPIPSTSGSPVPVPKVEVRGSSASRVGVEADANDCDDVEYVYRRQLMEFIDQPQFIDRPIDKDARLTYIGTDISNLNFLVREQFGSTTTSVYHFPSNRIPRRHTCHDPGRLPVEAAQLPPKPVVDRLLEAYFTYVNPGFPVVDEIIFMDQYRAKDPENPPSLLLLHSILVVGAHVTFDEPDRTLMKTLFFRRAKSLFDARFERNRDTTVQAALLLTWHADGPEDVAANAWFWLGLAVRTAMGLGMHRDAENSTLVPHNKRMWRRVWWLLFQCDVLLSLQYGRPQSIHLEDSDVQKLKPSDFQDCGVNSRVEYVTQMTELCVVISEALRERFRLKSTQQSKQAMLQKTDEALAHWSLHLPHSLQLRVTPTLDIGAANLQLVYNAALILLHRAQPYRLKASRTHREDSDICITAAATIQSIFQCLCDKSEIKCLWTSSINCLFTALIQLSIEVRFSNPVLAISALRRYDSALLSLRELARYWPNAQSILHFFENSVRLQESHQTPTQANYDAQQSSGLNSRSRTDSLRETFNRDNQSRTIIPREIPKEVARPPLLTTHSSDTGYENTPMAESESHNTGTPASVSQQQDSVVTGQDNSGEGIESSWHEWRQTYWQQPEFEDDFLFTF